MEILNNTGKYTYPNLATHAAAFRAVHEPTLAHHFGAQIMNELFDLYENKLVATPIYNNIENDKTIIILVVLKRTTH